MTNLKNSGVFTHSSGVRNTMLSEDSKKLLRKVFQEAKSQQPPDDSPQLLRVPKRNRGSSPMQQHGSTEDVGKQSKTLKTNTDIQQQLPQQAESKESRRQKNLLDHQWRNGFGCLMVTLSACTLKKFSVSQICIWAQALSEHDIEDLREGFSEYIQSGDGFPTVGKLFELVSKSRRNRKGLIVR